jgi:hypothetical protein
MVLEMGGIGAGSMQEAGSLAAAKFVPALCAMGVGRGFLTTLRNGLRLTPAEKEANTRYFLFQKGSRAMNRKKQR